METISPLEVTCVWISKEVGGVAGQILFTCKTVSNSNSVHVQQLMQLNIVSNAYHKPH